MTDIETRIAVLENKVENLEYLHREANGSLLEAINAIRADIKDIYEFINKSKGSMAALLLAASVITGIVVSVVSWGLTHFLK